MAIKMRRREERMAKEWANKDKYRPSNGVLEDHVWLEDRWMVTSLCDE
jgi:hypothetical protein